MSLSLVFTDRGSYHKTAKISTKIHEMGKKGHFGLGMIPI